MKILPLYDRVLLKPIKLEIKSSLLLPDTSNKSQLMEVIEIGNNTTTFNVKVGDHVLINKYAGSEFLLDNQEYLLIKECDILAVVKE